MPKELYLRKALLSVQDIATGKAQELDVPCHADQSFHPGQKGLPFPWYGAELYFCYKRKEEDAIHAKYKSKAYRQALDFVPFE